MNQRGPTINGHRIMQLEDFSKGRFVQKKFVVGTLFLWSRGGPRSLFCALMRPCVEIGSVGGASEEQKISLSDRRAALFDYVLLLPAKNAVVVDRAWGLHFNYSPHNVFGHSTFLRT